jgi:hypothetical protein
LDKVVLNVRKSSNKKILDTTNFVIQYVTRLSLNPILLWSSSRAETNVWRSKM